LLRYSFNGAGSSLFNLNMFSIVSATPGTLSPSIAQTGTNLGGPGHSMIQLSPTSSPSPGISDPGCFSTNVFIASYMTSASWSVSFISSGYDDDSLGNTYYAFGNGDFCCFTGGAAGANNWMLSATGLNSVTIPGGAVGTGLNTFIYDQTTHNVYGYLNGILKVTVSQTVGFTVPAGTSNLKVGGNGGDHVSPIGAKLDEFLLWTRALTVDEATRLLSIYIVPV
jgi:hypothetical protein